MSEEFVEWEGFNEEMPEDLFAAEEMYYGERAKCRGGGKAAKRDKFVARPAGFQVNSCAPMGGEEGSKSSS